MGVVSFTELRICFTTIAMLLGTGILGLPIKLVLTGFTPFVIVMTAVLAMQIAVVVLTTDVLQRARIAMARAHPVAVAVSGDSGTSPAAHAGTTVAPSSNHSSNHGSSSSSSSKSRHSVGSQPSGTSNVMAPLPAPDLHTVGRMYLPSPAAALAFDALVLLTFISTLISYALAGSQSFADALGVAEPASLITPFVLICTGAIVFAGGALQPVISALTVAKVVVLIVIIGLCGIVANEVGIRPSTSWAEVMQPFLVGTVAIGGIGNLLPVMFPTVPHTRAGMLRLITSVSVGIGVCYILNLVWALFVLGIVPQTAADAAARGMSVSLEQASARGEIATVAVLAVIRQSYPQYNYIATSVTAFITLSITVSFNAVGLGLKHVMDGISRSLVTLAFGASLSETDGGADREADGEKVSLLSPLPRGSGIKKASDVGQVRTAVELGSSTGEAAGLHTLSAAEVGNGGAAADGINESAYGSTADGTSAGSASNGDPGRHASRAPTIGPRPRLSQLAITVRNAVGSCSPANLARRLRAAATDPGLLRSLAVRAAVYAAGFGIVLVIALANPNGFLSVLEIFTSMSLNMTSGVFIAMLYVGARHHRPRAPGPSSSRQDVSGDALLAELATPPMAFDISDRTGAFLATGVLASFAVAVVYDAQSTLEVHRDMSSAASGWMAAALVVAFWYWCMRPSARVLWACMMGERGSTGGISGQFASYDAIVSESDTATASSAQAGGARNRMKHWSRCARVLHTCSSAASGAATWLRVRDNAYFVADAVFALLAGWAHTQRDTLERSDSGDGTEALAGALAGTLVAHQVLVPALRRLTERTGRDGAAYDGGDESVAELVAYAAAAALALWSAGVMLFWRAFAPGALALCMALLLVAASARRVALRCCAARAAAAAAARGGPRSTGPSLKQASSVAQAEPVSGIVAGSCAAPVAVEAADDAAAMAAQTSGSTDSSV